jgi:serine O-acetyltransferase
MNKDNYYQNLLKEHQECPTCPSPVEVIQFYKKLTGLFFQDFSTVKLSTADQIKVYEARLKSDFYAFLVNFCKNGAPQAQKQTDAFFDSFPTILALLHKDIEAAFQDPAAKSKREIIRSYPGFYAIIAYRIAHTLLKIGVNDIPRIITEYAHSKTGIDIHPGATIGEYFFIDHGTGVVIGETTHIGDHVKIYQGVTLGALSVDKADASVKRHPTIEDHVVIYASATILGGKTIIGEHSIVGGNVWLTRSIPPHTKVYYKAAMNLEMEKEFDTYVFKDM